MALTDAEQRELLAKVRSTDLRVQELDQQLTDGADRNKAGISKRILDALARLDAARSERRAARAVRTAPGAASG